MTSSRIQSRLLIAICLLASPGCINSEPESTTQTKEYVATFSSAKLATEEDVQHVVSNAASSNRAIMFVNVDWAIMEPQRTRFAEFAIDFRHKYPDKGALFHFVDCTPISGRYEPLRSLPGWKELEDAAGTSLIQAWGELVWMEHGHVLHVERILNFDSAASLIEKTESLMPQKNRE